MRGLPWGARWYRCAKASLAGLVELLLMPAPIVIIGMSRSGTTFVARLLEAQPGVHLETEPHMLWKAGSFAHLADDVVEDDTRATAFIRETLLRGAGEATLVEKSPVNCLRPELVHRVFPDARIVYVERDATRCIASNYRRTLKQESLKPSIVIRKYLAPKRQAHRATRERLRCPSRRHRGAVACARRSGHATGCRSRSTRRG